VVIKATKYESVLFETVRSLMWLMTLHGKHNIPGL
jgi:hypothetical protein